MKQHSFLFVIMLLMAACTDGNGLSMQEKGDRAFREKAYGKAIVLWSKAVKDSPDPGGLYTKIGKTYLKLSKLDPAEKFLQKAVDADPENGAVQKLLARIRVIKGEHEKAFRQMEEITDTLEKDQDYYLLYGDLYMASGQYEKAETMYRKGMNANGPGFRAPIKLALCLKTLGRDSEAERFADLAGEPQVSDPLDFLLLADYCMVSGLEEKAETYLLHAVDTYPESVLLKTRLVRFYLQTGRTDKAEKMLSHLTESFPEKPRFKLLLADMYISGLRMEEAEIMLDKAKNTKGVSMADYHLLKGKHLLFQGRNAYAVSHFKTAISEKPGLAQARYLLGLAHFAGGQTKLAEQSFVNTLALEPGHPDSMIALGYLLYKTGEYDLALQYIQKALEVDPTSFRAIRAKGLCLFEQGRFEPAAQEFLKAAGLAPDASSMYFYAMALEQSGRLEDAARVYQNAIQLSPGLTDVSARYIRLLSQTGKTEEAGRAAERLVKKNPDSPVYYYIAADLAFRLEQYDKSEKYLEKALKLEDTPGYIFSLLAKVHRKTGNKDRAVKVLHQCTAVNPRYEKGWNELAGLHMELGAEKMALETLNKAYEHVPQSPEIAANLAWLLLESATELDRALDLARKAYEADPQNAAIADTLGWAYYHKKAYSQAGWMFETAENLAPDQGMVKYHRAMLNYQQGKILTAKQLFGKVLEYKQRLAEKTVNHAQELLASLQNDEDADRLDADEIFDTKTPLDSPGRDREDTDILKPDWSELNNKP